MRILVLFVAAMALLAGCQKAEKVTDDHGVNKWVHETLRQEYLWSSTLGSYEPSGLSPDKYLDKVRYRDNRAVELKKDFYGDRFSRIEYTGAAGRFVDGASFFEGDYVENFGFTGMRYINNDDEIVFGQVIYVVPGSPADKAGIKRGYNYNAIQVGSAVYKMPMSTSNYNALMSGRTVKLNFFYPQKKTIELTAASYLDHPILMDSVYQTAAGKTAYLVYNHFTSGSNDRFNRDLKAVFADFKQKGATNLILDLRYNGGGELDAAVLLASLIARPTDLQKPLLFIERNVHRGKDYRQYDVVGFQSLASMGAGNNLNVDKLFVITLNHTASASELVMHCLKPYFGNDLKHIGMTTYGKNVGSITITNSRYDWSLTPITMRVYDRDGVSGYEKGIVPGSYVTDEDLNVMGDGVNSPLSYSVVGDFGEIEDNPDIMLLKVMNLINTGQWGVPSRAEGGAGDPGVDFEGRKEPFPALRQGVLTEGERIVP